MRRVLLAVLVIAVAALAAVAQDADRGVIDANNNLSSKLGRFSVALPTGFGAFTFVNPKRNDPGDPLINQYSSDASRGTWMIAYYDISASVLAAKTAQQILNEGRDGAVKGAAGAVLKRDDAVTVDGFPGRSFYVEIPNSGQPIYARFVYILSKSRVYNYLFLSTDESELYKPDVKKYFDSFHITN